MERKSPTPVIGHGKKQVLQQITAEINKIEHEISPQKKIVKASVGNTLAIEAAEQELKALHTRKDALTDNLTKLELDPA
jgi:hypothetical protein